MNNFNKPIKVPDIDIAFGGKMKQLLPAYDTIPDEFKKSYGYWQKWQRKWFYEGLMESDIPKPKEGIDIDEALRHLEVIQGSFEPRHEHKEAGVAYLASKWFVTPENAKP